MTTPQKIFPNFIKNDCANDQWFAMRPMTTEQWDKLRDDGWRYMYEEMPLHQPEVHDFEHQYYWFSTTSKHFIHSPGRQGTQQQFFQMLYEAEKAKRHAK